MILLNLFDLVLVDGIAVARVFISCFLAILFLQSGLDKVFNYSDNLSWLKGHFAGSPLSGMVPLMLLVITLMEVAAGGFSLAGAVFLMFDAGKQVAQTGIELSGVALIMLFFGQRMAKDYEGAATLVNYFILVLVGWLFFL